ncbi:hypothetical protein Cabys_268 [Caldithrix abyssi DSM 13497]|uniref:Uncharacterized protein n=1 Tax=Caldithrix abyssi DSM 13497 TaxID=880073 RepID=A0A1J1C2V3_CALAY|nr:hypothetical protein Cabys_268 [Caldithrix abyssi DSM 13497]
MFKTPFEGAVPLKGVLFLIGINSFSDAGLPKGAPVFIYVFWLKHRTLKAPCR